ncbi:hypothetical protein HKX17_15690 [Sulfitobacter sp. KE34]|uniref:DUF669 domain-containing protein n=1 Tax=unclassified Sulfitobacter TaxID=196795 RepID=UPI0023E23959|nr:MULTISPECIES: DUF669 domain-containing protein [unclassified Sulfitobacter]MDF3351596.1 hypothetical protein [Sulfitobacter sp. KE12]MDF3355268.1 hypothetical protein [Sulfitobacter sp. KE27]MDF3358916.1 hypothetical protein [Sulfitobacter sp. KE33]MDF3366340.1 hypothetical protein [Sulfitobacter sp. Ks34]MDF3369949.1 hypothetical protein [Sulfitobacter sp. Ks43]
MPKMSQPFNARKEVEGDLIADGEYTGTICATSLRVTENGNEEVLVIESELNTGDVIRDWLWINSSYTASRERARKSLAQLCLALGIDELDETDQLHGRSVVIRVKTQRGEGYQPRNRYAYSPLRDDTAAPAKP